MEKANPSGIMKYCTVDGIGYIELKLLEKSLGSVVLPFLLVD
jgi:hypothetical protein